MAQLGEELAFLKTQALALRKIPLTLPNDYQPALEDFPKRVLPFQITLLPPPTKVPPSDPSSSGANPSPSSLSQRGSAALVIKSTKPSLTFNLNVHPTDTIAQIKAQLAAEHPRAPSADDQRLLLKGKVLADAKLLKEYPISASLSEPTLITLMAKPGSNWTGEERTSPPAGEFAPPAGIVASEPATIAKPVARNLARPGTGHTRSLSGAADEMPVPSVTLSPTPDTGSPKRTPAVQLDMDLNMIADPPRAMTPTAEGFYHIVSDPAFWQRLMDFLNKEFRTPEDAQRAWEDFFLASKGHLSAHEIAKIRDVTGVVAMAGI
jgi:UV excision repair protein RAD23